MARLNPLPRRCLDRVLIGRMTSMDTSEGTETGAEKHPQPAFPVLTSDRTSKKKLIIIVSVISALMLVGVTFIIVFVVFGPKSNLPASDQKATNKSGRHITLDLFKDSFNILQDPSWLPKLDEVYEAYVDLVGQEGYGGPNITLKEGINIGQEAEMLSGDPILWESKFVADKLRSVNEYQDLSFGPVHELGHNFDYYLSSASYLIGSVKAINPEHWANFKLTYVADTLGAKYPNWTFYQQSSGYMKLPQFSHDYFVERFAKPWIAKGQTDWQTMENDVFTGLLYMIREEYGWEPFKKTFREYNSMTGPSPASDLAKIQLFADTLNKYTPRRHQTSI